MAIIILACNNIEFIFLGAVIIKYENKQICQVMSFYRLLCASTAIEKGQA